MRLRAFTFLIIFFFLVLAVGLLYMQVLKGPAYRRRSEENSIRVIPLEAPRGRVFDRKQRAVVDNKLSFDVSIVYSEVRSVKETVDVLSRILGMDKKKLSASIKKAKTNPYIPYIIAGDIGKKKAIILEEKKRDLTGLEINTRPKRFYPYEIIGCHIFGYIGKIMPGELERLRSYGYRMTDFVGRDGLEKQYDSYLKGADGGMQVEVNSLGQVVNRLGIKEPVTGRNLNLCLDIELEKFCYERLGSRNGAILAMEPNTGEVLALVSKPGFDPNIFVKSKGSQIKRYLNSKDYLLVDRAISGQYPPGSVFKVVTAAAALDTKRFTAHDILSCNGEYRVGRRVFHCWKEKGHGAQDIKEAMKNSCNVFFYQLGLRAGVDHISNYALKFGFGRPTGIDLPGEKKGFVPTRLWKRIKLRESWYDGETVNYSIGQGYLLVTPVQVLRAIACIANGGRLVTPHIVKDIDGVEVSSPKATTIGISKVAMDLIREGLKKVVNDRRGTGMRARLKNIVVAGKTGTAQNPRGMAHGWFAGFAPYQDPKFCVVVLVEYGGKGGLEASMIARDVIKKAEELGLI